MLPGSIVVIRCSSPVMMVLDVPSEISLYSVPTLTRPKTPKVAAGALSLGVPSISGRKAGRIRAFHPDSRMA